MTDRRANYNIGMAFHHGPPDTDHEQETLDMIEPTNDDIGRMVVYRAAPDFNPEQGVITSINERGVFVRYGHTGTSQLTDRADLEWLT